MPTKVKGMTSLEIAIIVVVVLAIAVAVAWYLYSTFAATIDSSSLVAVTSAVAFTNGTIRVDLLNRGSTVVRIADAFVFDRMYTVRGGRVISIDPAGGTATVYIDTGRWPRIGSIIQGKLITENGNAIPFSARVIA